MTPGWSSFLPISSSRWKRSKKTGSLSISGCGTLMATARPVAQVRAAEDGSHAAARRQAVDAVVVELVAGMEGSHEIAGQPSRRRRLIVSQLVRPSAVHAHAFHAADADELHADIIAAVPLVGKRRPVRGRRPPGAVLRVTMRAMSDGGHGAVQPVGAKQQHIARKHLVLAGIDADEHVVAQRAAEHVARGQPPPLPGR